MYNFTINGLQIHGPGIINYWLQSPIQGLDMPDYRVTEYDKPGEDGSVVSAMFYSSRGITLTGMVRGDNPTIFETNRNALITALSIQKDSNGYPTPIRCTFTTLAGNTYFFDAYLASKPVFDYDQINFSNFLINMKVTSPFIFGSNPITSGAVVRASGGGFILPVILPIVFGSAIGGTTLLNNIGNATAYPIITLTGPLTNPYIYSNAVQKLMQLNYSLLLGDVVVIDMAQKTIVLNGSNSLLTAKTSDSEWWGILPGNNQINFSTGSTADTGNMKIDFYPAYLGA